MMTQPNPKQHYRLSLDKAIQDYKDGIITATGLVYYAVGIYRAPGQKLRVKDVEAFSSELNIGISTFYKAISRLKAKGRLHWEAISGLNLWIPTSNVVEIQSGQEVSTIVECDSTNVECDSTNGECQSTIVECDSTNVEFDSTNVENESLEPSHSKESDDSSDILSNKLQSLSTSFQMKKVVGGVFKNFVVVEEEEIQKEEQSWLAKIFDQLRAISVNPKDVEWAIREFPEEVIQNAIAYVAEQKIVYKPAGLFIKACRDSRKPKKAELLENFPAPPEPSEEQVEELRRLKRSGEIRDFYLAPVEHGHKAYIIDTGSNCLFWWDFLKTDEETP